MVALDEAPWIHERRGDALRQGETEQLRAQMLVSIGRVEEARAAAEGAVSLLAPLAPGRELARAYSALAGISAHTDDVEGATTWGHLGADLGERVGDAGPATGPDLARLDRTRTR